MSLLGETTVIRRRRDGGAWVAGRWVRGVAVDTAFLASVQRLTGRDRQVDPTGDRARADRKALTLARSFLRTEDQYSTLEADEVVAADGNAYTVVHVDDEHPLIPYDMAFLVRVNEASTESLDADLLAILAEVRTWLMTLNSNSGVTIPETGVIFSKENGPRPPLPYVALDITDYDERIGYDEEHIGTNARSAPKGQRTGTLVMQGVGAGAGDWIERAVYLLTSPESSALLSRSWLEPLGPMLDASGTLDTDTEVRFRRDFTITYERVADAGEEAQGVEMEQVVYTTTIGDRVIVTTEDLP